MLSSPNEEQEFRRATTYTASPIAKRDMAMIENHCLLFLTASVAWLNLGPGGNTARRPTTEGNAFWNLQMVATFTIPARAVCYRDASIKELNG